MSQTLGVANKAKSELAGNRGQVRRGLKQRGPALGPSPPRDRAADLKSLCRTERRLFGRRHIWVAEPAQDVLLAEQQLACGPHVPPDSQSGWAQ